MNIDDFLLNHELKIGETKDVFISKRFADENDKLIPFKIRTISEAEHKAIRQACTRTMTDKLKGRSKELDRDKYALMMVVECTVEPNFKNAELQAKYSCVSEPEKLLGKILLPGEFVYLSDEILTFNGFNDDINEMAEEIKN